MVRIYALFLASGAAGLIYQVVWSRLLHEVFGVTVYAVTTVLATFLAGLALGGFLLGRAADRRANPLRFYGWLEIGIAVAALAGLWTIRLLEPAHIWAASRFAPNSGTLLGIRFLLGALVVLPPTFLMGGTLPAITRATVDHLRRFGRKVSLLYALNTAGAVIGTLATGFLFIRWIGLHATLGIGVGLNLLVGVIALLLSRARSGRPAREAAGQEDRRRRSTADTTAPARGLLVVMALSGFVSLGLEVLWTRVLMLSVGTTTYSFATMLASFLIGITLGSLVARRYIDRLTEPRRLFGWLQIAIAVTVLATLPLINAGLTQRWLSGWGGNWVILLLLRFGVSLLIMVIPTTLIGMTFPLAAKLWTRRLGQLGGQLGEVYGANTVGNILGAVATGFVLLPWLGLQKGIAVLTVLNLACAAWGFFPQPAGGRNRRTLVRAVPILGGLALCATVLLAWQPGPFPVWGERPGDLTLYYREGVAGTVKVIQRAGDPRQVWMAVDSIKIGESRGGVDQKQQALAHFPFLLQPERPPRTLLSIGLGTGILVGEIARHPGVEQVDCLEISPSVIDAARQFETFNAGALDDPDIRVINDDGINFLRRTEHVYDTIVSDAKSRSKHAANALFFSLDYYRLCREHLDPQGLMIQWIPLNVPPQELRTILRTFFQVFSHGYVWLAPPHSAFVVGTAHPLTLQPELIQATMRQPATQHLARYGMASAADFIGALAADRPALEAWLGTESTINTLEHPVLEFYSPRAYTIPPLRRADENLVGIVRGRGERLSTVTIAAPPASSESTAQAVLGPLAEAFRINAERNPAAVDAVVRTLDRASRRAPGQRLLRYGEAIALRQALELAPQNAGALCGLGQALLMLGQVEWAMRRFNEALSLEPVNAEALRGIATILATHPDPSIRDSDEAVRVAQRAAELTGRRDPRVLAVLSDAYASAGRFGLAGAAAREALPLAVAEGDRILEGDLRARMRIFGVDP